MGSLDVSFSLQGFLRHDSETGVVVSYCPALDIYSQGRDTTEAKAALVDAIGGFLKVCHERGILDDNMRRLGWTRAAVGSASAVPSGPRDFIQVRARYEDTFDFEVPLHLLRAESSKSPAWRPWRRSPRGY